MQISLSSKTQMGGRRTTTPVLTCSWASLVPRDFSRCYQRWTGSVFSHEALEFMILWFSIWGEIKFFNVAQMHLKFSLPLKPVTHLYRIQYLADTRKNIYTETTGKTTSNWFICKSLKKDLLIWAAAAALCRPAHKFVKRKPTEMFMNHDSWPVSE